METRVVSNFEAAGSPCATVLAGIQSIKIDKERALEDKIFQAYHIMSLSTCPFLSSHFIPRIYGKLGNTNGTFSLHDFEDTLFCQIIRLQASKVRKFDTEREQRKQEERKLANKIRRSIEDKGREMEEARQREGRRLVEETESAWEKSSKMEADMGREWWCWGSLWQRTKWIRGDGGVRTG